MPSIALVSTPWPLFNRPSIQLGTLKAFLRRELPELRVDAHHLYLGVAEAVGYELYKSLSERSWLSEACYAALLYPEQEELVGRFWSRQAMGLTPKPDFKKLCRSLEQASERVLRSVRWRSYPLVGLSICLGQLTSSLYFIRKIKGASPQSRIVVGGSSCAGEMGASLLRTFPEIDFVVNGEGELPLLHLAKTLSPESGANTAKYVAMDDTPSPFPSPPARGRGRGEGVQTGLSAPGLLSRTQGTAEDFSQVDELDDLPAPDYTDYFDLLKQLPEAKRFLPKLPMEMSRGCWWRKKVPPEKSLCRNVVSRRQPRNLDSGCAFCNLNLQWRGYRSKSHRKIIEEIDSLTGRYELLSVSFMDNLLPPKNLKTLFESLAGLGKDLRFFAEIRATTSADELLAMRRAGAAEVQVGIEALSTRLLRKLNKGTTAIQNVEIMKNCEAGDLPDLTANLITRFPGSDKTDVEETLRTLPFVLPFRPLKATPFWLGYGSPVWLDPKAFGIGRLRNHPFYAYLFPPEILSRLRLMLQGYEGGVKTQQRLWGPVTRALKSWRTTYDDLHSASNTDPILSYRDGGTYLIIRQRRWNADDRTHRLRGSSRGIYLFCESNRSVSEVVEQFPGFGQEKILPFLTMMVDKKLMFREGERVLSLAVPIRGFKTKFEIRI